MKDDLLPREIQTTPFPQFRRKISLMPVARILFDSSGSPAWRVSRDPLDLARRPDRSLESTAPAREGDESAGPCGAHAEQLRIEQHRHRLFFRTDLHRDSLRGDLIGRLASIP